MERYLTRPTLILILTLINQPAWGDGNDWLTREWDQPAEPANPYRYQRENQGYSPTDRRAIIIQDQQGNEVVCTWSMNRQVLVCD